MTDCLHECLLLDRVSKNDREAFKIIYTQYLNDTYRYLFLFTKSREACEEIVQSVFMKIWERRAHLGDITNFKSYIYRSAKNMLIDEIRRKKVGERAFAQFEFDHWSTDNTDAKFPRVNVTSQNNSATSSYWLQNGKYIRLKTLQFGYNFPKSMLSKVGIDGVRLYVAGFNLITFTKVYFLDPESPVYDGNDDYPQQKVINVGLNLNF